MRMCSNSQGTDGSVDDAIKLVNALYWNITFFRENHRWQLFTGDPLIGTFKNKPEMESFIRGMALAIGVLPPEIIEQIRKFVE